ncbi:heme oxygenase (biliverdin-producing) [Actinomadura rugatobispora]|uniref:Heme oxygenase (Biliverdin-producing) n=1 Tax=Actinomadura rugatobispora TaxID=1994 RepID=A0ABW0ZXY6_9ACTN|nr:biliverdin-producing heme oxygenase [Actinomadura rugatobispora]
MADQESGFAQELREATKSDHDGTGTSTYMSALFDGRLGREQYAALVAQLHPVYDLLEQAADRMSGDPVAGAFALDGLSRRDALEADLAFLYGPDWRDRIDRIDRDAGLQATRRYCDRLREVCFDWPGGFVAHHYTRYLGDLSGGQYMGVQVRKILGLAAGEDGVRFYRFPGAPKTFKEQYRALLDAAPWDEVERARIVDEVKRAYRLNAEITAELGHVLDIEPAA